MSFTDQIEPNTCKRSSVRPFFLNDPREILISKSISSTNRINLTKFQMTRTNYLNYLINETEDKTGEHFICQGAGKSSCS